MTPSDRTAANRALYDAYVEATDFRVALSRERIDNLAELVDRGITPSDVKAAMADIKACIKNGQSGYVRSSIYWHNAMNPDKLEMRVLDLRAKAQQRPRKPVAIVPQTRRISEDATVTVLAPDTSEGETPTAGNVAPGVLRKLKDQLAGKSPEEVAALPACHPTSLPQLPPKP